MSLTPEQIEYYKAHADDTLQPQIKASHTTGLILAIIFVGLRIWARKVGKTRLGYDDWLIVASLPPLATYGILGWIQVSFGEGKHIIFVTNIPGFIQAYVTTIVAYSLCVVFTKLSILCFYCRIFSPMQRLYYISWAFGIFIVLYNLALIFVTAFQCIPLSSMWTGRPGKCIDTLPPFTALGVINVVTDVGILALPIQYISQLQLSVTRRIQVCGIFLLGSVVCIFGIVRVVALARAAPGDPSYNQVWSGIWSFCEIAIGIVAACLPTLAILTTKSHLSKVSASAIHLLSLTFRRSNNSSRHDTNSTLQNMTKSGNENPDYVHLSELSLVGDKGEISLTPNQRDTRDVSTYVSSNSAERGEVHGNRQPQIFVKNEVVQTVQ